VRDGSLDLRVDIGFDARKLGVDEQASPRPHQKRCFCDHRTPASHSASALTCAIAASRASTASNSAVKERFSIGRRPRGWHRLDPCDLFFRFRARATAASAGFCASLTAAVRSAAASCAPALRGLDLRVGRQP
jgi:hypothetical protein